MFLGMRQEPIDRLESCKAMLERQCLQLPPEQRQILRGILQGQTPPPQAQALGELVQKNKRDVYKRQVQYVGLQSDD